MSSSSKEQQFWNAAHAGDLELVKTLAADTTLDVNWQDPRYFLTHLSVACWGGQVSVVEFLFKQPKVDVNKPNNNECTPFYVACHKSHKEVVSLLLVDKRIDVNKPNKMGTSPFFYACLVGYAELVKLLVADKRIDINKPNNNTSTSLWIASQNGHLSIVQLMLASGQEVRFFEMAQELPLELQMVLCNRAFGAGEDIVLTKDSESAFKRLGRLRTKEDEAS